MPTYEYECKKCGRVFDYFQSMSSPTLKVCPEEICQDKGEVSRLVSAGSGLIFKGSGFYITDYKKSSAPSGSESKSDGGASSKPESAPSTPEKTSTPAPAPATSSPKSE